jgi:hypothetical protein
MIATNAPSSSMQRNERSTSVLPNRFDRLVIAAFMLAYIASAIFGGSGYDTARDVAEAFAIRHLNAFPLHGPLLAGTLHLGPIWFYVLALPLVLHESWLSIALFAAALGSLQFPLAYAAGRRLLDSRLGLLWVALLALPGWGSFELMGFGHANMVRVCTMLVLYALVRLAQDRRPEWLVLASGALALAIHAHPSAAPLVFVVIAVAAFALHDIGVLLRWGAVSLLVAALPFAPLAIEQARAPSALLGRTGDLVEGMVRIENLANVPALLYGILIRGPRVIADAFFSWSPGISLAVEGVILAIELAAGIGLIAAFRVHRRLVLAGLGVVIVVTASVAWLRPVTPFWMTYAMLPPLAGLGALGLCQLCALSRLHGASICNGLIGLILALHVATVWSIAHAISSGGVQMALLPRIDIKQDDSSPPQPEPWLPAYAVDASGKLLCKQSRTIVLHATYAYLADSYFGLDHRLYCGSRDIRLLGTMPATASHLVALGKPLWAALGWQPAASIGGLGIAPAARVISPATGYVVPDGSVYPPYQTPAGPARTLILEAETPAPEALVVSLPHFIWMPSPALTLKVSANGESQSPVARDAISIVYACRRCASERTVSWRVEIESVAPEWIDVVTLAPH